MTVTLTVTAADGATTTIPLADPVINTDWHDLTIGAGGYCIGADMASDGSMVVRCDVANCYLLDTTSLSNRWKNLILNTAFPSAYWDLWAGNPGDSIGGHEIKFAPSQPTTLYCTTMGRLWKSVDRGITWNFCPFPNTSLTSKTMGIGILNATSNDGTDKLHQQKLMVDPNNPNVIHLAFRQSTNTASGGKLAASYDGGQTFAFKPLPRGAPSNGVDATCAVAAAATLGATSIVLTGNPAPVIGTQFYNLTTAHWYNTEVASSSYNATTLQTTVTLSAPLDKPIATTDSLALFVGTYGVVGISYDRDSPIVNGRTQVLYASPFYRGMWRSADGGQTWTCISGWYAEGQPGAKLPGPAFVWETKVYKNALYCIQRNSGNFANDGLWRWTQAGGWKQIIGNTDISFVHTTAHSFDFDPFVPDRMVAVHSTGRFNISLDAGTTWSGWSKRGSDAPALDETDTPWMADLNPYALGVNSFFFDRKVQNRGWTAGSSSPWWADVPVTITAPNTDGATTTVPTWHVKGRDIEELVSNWVLAIPGNPNKKVLAASWDVGLFNITPGQQPQSSIVPKLCNTTAPTACWDLDYAAPSPGYAFAWSDNWYSHFNQYFPMVTSDYGETWKTVPVPPFQYGLTYHAYGSVACCGAGKFIYAPWMGRQPYYTIDEGQTWHFVSLSDATKNDGAGWIQDSLASWSFFLGSNWATHRPFCADRVLPNTYYLLFSTGGAVNSGVYRSSDAGVTWQRRNPAPINWGYYPVHEIAAVPGKAGHLFVSSLSNTTARFSSDGGISWITVSPTTFRGPFCIGFGAPKIIGRYPSIYVVGYYSLTGVFDKTAYGIFRIDDFDPTTGNGTFVKLGSSYPNGNINPIWSITGDMDKYGRVYLVPKNYGFQFGDFL